MTLGPLLPMVLNAVLAVAFAALAVICALNGDDFLFAACVVADQIMVLNMIYIWQKDSKEW